VLKIFAVVAARFQSELAKMVGDVVARPIQLLCSVAATFELIARQELDGLEKLLSRERSSRLRPAKFSKVRSEEHTSELQSRFDLVCRLLLEKKKKNNNYIIKTTINYNLH